MLLLTLSNFIGFGISTLVTLFISIHLIGSYFKSREKTVGYFAGFIATRLGLFFFSSLTSLVYLISGNPLTPAVMFLIAWILTFISLIFPPLLFTSLKWQAMKIIYPGTIAGLGILGIISLIKGFTPAIIDPKTGLALIILPQLPQMFYMLSKFFGVTPLAVLFLSQARSGEKWMKARSLLIGLGLLWVVSTIIIPTLLPSVWAGIYCCIGDILIFTGIKYKKPNI